MGRINCVCRSRFPDHPLDTQLIILTTYTRTDTTASTSPAAEGQAIGISLADKDSGVTFYEYDGFNQLTKTTTGDTTVNYTYNGDGLRTSKTVNGNTTSHIWDGDQIALELNGAGSVTNKYVRGINLLSSENGNGADKRYFLYNGHGDVIQLTDTAGNLVKSYDYDAFGNEKAPDPNDTNLFRYCGEYFDKETGTIYLRARYYDPGIGRFITEDSVWGKDADPLSLNLYTYCGNDPEGLIDPSGHSAVATGPVGLIKKVFETVLNIGKDMYIYDYKFTTAAGAYFLDMRVDKNGIYHANFDCWQSAFGYNNFYDNVFDTFTSMDREKFQFNSGGKEYMLWAWKGDYLNLGAGAELGIYYDSIIPGQWSVDKSQAMKMSMALQYTDPETNKTSTIINYSPGDKQWWITGFNPNYKGVNANNLTVSYTVTFTQTIYTNFYNKFGDKNSDYYDSRWTGWDSKKFSATFNF